MKNLGFLGFPNHVITPQGVVIKLTNSRIIKPTKDKKGYIVVALCDFSKVKKYKLHRLLCMAFKPVLENFSDLQVNHIDGDKQNNSLSNLEWCTLKENVEHSVVTGLRDSQKLYSEDIVHKVCKLMAEGYRNVDIAGMVDIHLSRITAIRQGIAYPNISKQYQIPIIRKSSKVGVDKVLKICKLLQDGLEIKDVAAQVGVSYPTVRTIYKRQTYKDLSSNFSW